MRDHSWPDGELAVEMQVRLLADGRVVGHAGGDDVRLEVRVPAPLPVELALVVDGELRGAGVVRAVEDVGRDVDLGPGERAEDAIVIGQVEDAADIQQHGFRCRHRSTVARALARIRAVTPSAAVT